MKAAQSHYLPHPYDERPIRIWRNEGTRGLWVVDWANVARRVDSARKARQAIEACIEAGRERSNPFRRIS